MLSLIIPTLNAGDQLAETLERLKRADEVIVVDGGSDDETCALAAARGARILGAPRGRGPQLAAGARAARGDWLLFLHADTRLDPTWHREVGAYMASPANRQRAAVFTYALDDSTPWARRLERIVAWRIHRFALPYGDQGLLISREFHDTLGGYAPIPLMEDVDLVRRIGRHRLDVLATRATTSAARYRRDGYLRRTMRNLFCLSLFLLGVPARWIARLYR